MAKAMEQAGVKWDEKQAAEVRRDVSRKERPDTQITSHPVEKNTGSQQPPTDWVPLPAFLGALIAGGLGYFIGEASLAPYPHPSHWIAAAMAGFLGYAGGFIWHQTRGY